MMEREEDVWTCERIKRKKDVYDIKGFTYALANYATGDL